MINFELDAEYKEVFDFLSKINCQAYKDTYLISNEVLSKNPFASNFVKNFVNKVAPKKYNILTIAYQLILYFFKSSISLLIYTCNFGIYYISNLRFKYDLTKQELILVDTYFLIDRINKTNSYEDPYFPGLKHVLDKLQKHYAYVPVFYLRNKNPLLLWKTLLTLKNQQVPVLTEFQLLSFRDFYKISKCILLYPVALLKLLNSLKNNSYAYCLLKTSLIETLNQPVIMKYSRYLQGYKIANLGYKKIKVISWYENQTIDKNLYKGLRESRKQIIIYGAQPFIYAKSFISITPDENEVQFDVVPDIVVVNGMYYMRESKNIKFRVGPSFRYKDVFKSSADQNKVVKDNIVVLLPYFADELKNILQMLSSDCLKQFFFTLKLHPTTPLKNFINLIPANAVVTNDNIYNLLKSAKIVISYASGTMVEAVAMGVPVIAIRSLNNFDNNPLPLYGKELVWVEATNAHTLAEKIKFFSTIYSDIEQLQNIYTVADNYKRLFFCEPSEENIIKAYDLLNI